MTQSNPPNIDTPLTLEHIRAARWSAQHARKQGLSLIPMEVAQVLQLLDAAELGLAALVETRQ